MDSKKIGLEQIRLFALIVLSKSPKEKNVCWFIIKILKNFIYQQTKITWNSSGQDTAK